MSTFRLQLLGSAQVHHDYFADGWGRATVFEPSAACQDWMAQFGLMARAGGHALTVHAPESRMSDLWQESRLQGPGAGLDFTVSCVDPNWAYYTEDLTPQSMRIPLGMAQDEPAWRGALGQTQTLQWQARQSIWCYWLLGDWDDPDLSIVDAHGTWQFEALGVMAMDKGSASQAYCFRSRQALPLRERAPPGLQVRARNGRVLVPQLPAPRPSALQYEAGPDGRRAVSEIFVSR